MVCMKYNITITCECFLNQHCWRSLGCENWSGHNKHVIHQLLVLVDPHFKNRLGKRSQVSFFDCGDRSNPESLQSSLETWKVFHSDLLPGRDVYLSLDISVYVDNCS